MTGARCRAVWRNLSWVWRWYTCMRRNSTCSVPWNRQRWYNTTPIHFYWTLVCRSFRHCAIVHLVGKAVTGGISRSCRSSRNRREARKWRQFLGCFCGYRLRSAGNCGKIHPGFSRWYSRNRWIRSRRYLWRGFDDDRRRASIVRRCRRLVMCGLGCSSMWSRRIQFWNCRLRISGLQRRWLFNAISVRSGSDAGRRRSTRSRQCIDIGVQFAIVDDGSLWIDVKQVGVHVDQLWKCTKTLKYIKRKINKNQRDHK